jgi:UDP-glucose 4-epimerase
MRILVVGANGFVGSHLTRELRRLGHEIFTADIVSVFAKTHFAIDAVRPDFLSLALESKVEAWINCSGAANVSASFSDPVWDHELNTLRVLQMLDALRKNAPKTKYVHLSSAAVYGNPAACPVLETSALHPVSPYGLHKLQAEQHCLEYAKLFNVQTISARIFSAYGPGLRKQLFWDVFQKAQGSNTVELFGTGDETRDFIYVADLACALELLLKNGQFDGRSVNVASGQSTSVRLAVTSLFNTMGWSRSLRFNGNERQGDPINWQADISYLKRLGYSGGCSMEEGLSKVGEWLLSEDQQSKSSQLGNS